MRRTPRTFWLVATCLSLLLIAIAAPIEAGGGKGGEKNPPAPDKPVKTVTVVKFLILDPGGVGPQLLNDHDPEEPYVDHRITSEYADPCVTGWVNRRGGIFAYLYKGSSDPDHPLFTDCHSQVEPTTRGPRTYTLRLPDDGAYDVGQGTCCEVLGLAPDSEGLCTLPIIPPPGEWDYGSQRIRVGNIFGRKLEPVELDFLFYHTVGEERRSLELQSEGAIPVLGGGDYRNIKSAAQDTFRIVGIGGPEVCAGFPLSLDIDFWRVEVPSGS